MNLIDKQSLSRPDSTVYPLRGDEVDWFTGVASSGSQVLVVYQFPDVFVLTFTPNGQWSGLSSPPGFPIDQGAGFFSRNDDAMLHEWLDEVGFHACVINVRRFSLPQHHLGIVDLSSAYSKILLHPSLYSAEEFRQAEQEVEHWSSQGMFELMLNEFTNIWIDETGSIVAT